MTLKKIWVHGRWDPFSVLAQSVQHVVDNPLHQHMEVTTYHLKFNLKFDFGWYLKNKV